ncbi:hypothetical protein [Cytophaga hutchinsonii]|uniref:Uncharacterized protein n=1 Tax=Cytophaga hutchinsonii (strain ATCC 33406 / DSM 1761 / CIP 103989 / NBRC 15051 / NCIMB 9469 / D465) TaxID=269798 RepID=A0A6N4SQX7_CYTH3|nr:hypothetical protein [Cytophaga hutchinsonii]ABG58780.1 hypothetical protein CHU_1509 [Cytophaga hutchinsonii ATCC 33406]SFX61629.1 hypothetical protein SAMN04487930_106171 [Cytophaga hutchinsonii ATCC 33406]
MNSVTLTNYNTEFIIDEKDASSIKLIKLTSLNQYSNLMLIIKDENGSTLINRELGSFNIDPIKKEILINEEIKVFKFIIVSIYKTEMNQKFTITLYFETTQ